MKYRLLLGMILLITASLLGGCGTNSIEQTTNSISEVSQEGSTEKTNSTEATTTDIKAAQPMEPILEEKPEFIELGVIKFKPIEGMREHTFTGGMTYYKAGDSSNPRIYISHEIFYTARQTLEEIYETVVHNQEKNQQILSVEQAEIDGCPSYKIHMLHNSKDDTIMYTLIVNHELYQIALFQEKEITPESLDIFNKFIENLSVDDAYKPLPTYYDISEVEAIHEEYLNSVYEDYSKQIREKMPSLLDEYKQETAGIKDYTQRYLIYSAKWDILAKIEDSGIHEMASYERETECTYEQYIEWAHKLSDVLQEEYDKMYAACFGNISR